MRKLTILSFRSELDIRRDERNRIGRELHDSTAQLLVALQLRMAYFKEKLGEAELRTALSKVDTTIQELHREIRAVILTDVRPHLLSGELPAALRTMTERFGQLTGLKISLEMDGEHMSGLAEADSSVYRIVQEALANIWRHARATSARIRLVSSPAALRVSVEDDGIGIANAALRRLSSGIGLDNIRQRVRQLQGRLYVRRLRRGTRITVVVDRPDTPALFVRQ